MESGPVSKGALWTGRVIAALIVLLFLFSAAMKLAKPPSVVKPFTEMGFKEQMLVPLGILELLCAVVYAIPRTAVLGAILLTGYIGGTIVTAWRAGQSPIAQIVIGVLIWLAVYLRDRRLRALTPLRR